MAWQNWQEYLNEPVEVITQNRESGRLNREVFPNLKKAQEAYPTISPTINGKSFTWATRGQVDGKPALRFESWEAYNVLSS